MKEQPLEVQRRGAALWLTLNRPAVLNGINAELIAAMHAGLDTAERDDAVHAVVVAAAGRVFCAGADLAVIEQIGRIEDPQVRRGEFVAFLESVGGLFNRIEAFDKPVLAAVRGLAVAGGLELLLVCDIVIAARSARFGDAHASYGLLPGGGGSARLPRRVGQSLAKYLMFTGTNLPAAELAHTDLVTLLVEDHDLAEAAGRTVASIAAKSPAGIAAMKRLVAGAAEKSTVDGWRTELAALAEHCGTHDFAEGLAAFAGKRTPEFTDR